MLKNKKNKQKNSKNYFLKMNTKNSINVSMMNKKETKITGLYNLIGFLNLTNLSIFLNISQNITLVKFYKNM